MLREAGRIEEILTWHQRTDRTDALRAAAQMLQLAGRIEEADLLQAFGWEPDGSIAQPWTAAP